MFSHTGHGVGHMMEDKGKDVPGYRGNLNQSSCTIAELLKPASYRTYAVGKWHVTRHTGKDGPIGEVPRLGEAGQGSGAFWLQAACR